MEKTETRKRYDLDRITRLIISIICIIAAIMVINYLSGILLPFVIGGLLAYMLNPLVEWLMRTLFAFNSGSCNYSCCYNIGAVVVDTLHRQ